MLVSGVSSLLLVIGCRYIVLYMYIMFEPFIVDSIHGGGNEAERQHILLFYVCTLFYYLFLTPLTTPYCLKDYIHKKQIECLHTGVLML